MLGFVTQKINLPWGFPDLIDIPSGRLDLRKLVRALDFSENFQKQDSNLVPRKNQNQLGQSRREAERFHLSSF